MSVVYLDHTKKYHCFDSSVSSSQSHRALPNNIRLMDMVPRQSPPLQPSLQQLDNLITSPPILTPHLLSQRQRRHTPIIGGEVYVRRVLPAQMAVRVWRWVSVVGGRSRIR